MSGESGRWDVDELPAGPGGPQSRPFPQDVAAGRRTRCPGVVRRSRIVQLLRRSGYVQATDLSRLLGVSEMTIRRDLDELVREGVGVRVWGGLVSPGLAAPAAARPDQHEQRLERAQDHLRRAGQALDDGQLDRAREHVRAILHHLDQELAAGAVSSGR